MALTTFDEDVENISALGDQPNDDDGLTAAELKALFDKAGVDLKNYINNILIPELNDAISAAAQGIALQNISGNILSDGTVTSTKLSSDEGAEAVATINVRDYAITLAKLAQPVQTILENLQTNVSFLFTAMDTKAAAASLAEVATSGSYNDLTDLPTIPTVDSALSTTSTNPVQNRRVANAINAKQDTAIARTITFAKGSTSRNITCSGVTANNYVIVTPAPASYAQWVDNRMRMTGQGTDRVTISADTAPTADVSVNVLILP